MSTVGVVKIEHPLRWVSCFGFPFGFPNQLLQVVPSLKKHMGKEWLDELDAHSALVGTPMPFRRCSQRDTIGARKLGSPHL